MVKVVCILQIQAEWWTAFGPFSNVETQGRLGCKRVRRWIAFTFLLVFPIPCGFLLQSLIVSVLLGFWHFYSFLIVLGKSLFGSKRARPKVPRRTKTRKSNVKRQECNGSCLPLHLDMMTAPLTTGTALNDCRPTTHPDTLAPTVKSRERTPCH